MLGAKPTVFISHSEKFKAKVAAPFRDFAESLGMSAVLVSEMPTPEHGGGEPDAKVDYYLDRADMFVALMTPDDRTDSGEVHARPNVTDEITRARTRHHLRDRVQVFKASEVDVHSNINPTHEPLNPDDVSLAFPIFERQAMAWEIIVPKAAPEAPDRAVGPTGPLISRSDAKIVRGALGQAASSLGELQAGLLDRKSADTVDGVSVVARAHLASSVALAMTRSSSPFGVHDLNSLYREREALKLSQAEARFLLRTMILQIESANAPGWYWFRGRSTAAEVLPLVIEFALGDPEIAVRVRALNLIGASRIQIRRRTLAALVEHALDDNNAAIRAAGRRLLAARGDLRLIRELGALVEDRQSTAARLAIRARETPVAALRELITHPALHNDEIEADILESAKKLPASVLSEALKSNFVEIRIFAVRALDRSSRLQKEVALKIVESDGDSRVRMEAVRIGLRRRWKLQADVLAAAVRDIDSLDADADELKINFEGRESFQSLSAKLKWIGKTSWTTYAAMAEYHFPQVAQRLREELQSDFRSLRDTYRVEVESVIRGSLTAKIRAQPESQQPTDTEVAALVSEEIDNFFQDYEGLESFTIRRFRIAALRGLVAHGGQDDVRFARDLLNVGEKDVAALCVRLLDQFGDSSDHAALVERAKTLSGPDALDAARVALKVSEDAPDVIATFLKSDERELIEAAMAELEVPHADALEHLVPLMRSRDSRIRLAATERLIRLSDRQQQRALIDLYADAAPIYYYDVIVRLDGFLFAPSWLLAAVSSASE